MFARKQIDIGYRDLTAALGYCLWFGFHRRELSTDLEALWSEDDDAVAALSKIGGDLDIARGQLLVWGAAYERWVFTAAYRVVDICPQRHPVTRDHLLIALNSDQERISVRVFLVGCGHGRRSEITPMLTPGCAAGATASGPALVIMNLIQNLPGELQPFMYAAMQSLNWTSVSAHAGEILNPIRLSSGQASSE